jgi:hypothetical protein
MMWHSRTATRVDGTLGFADAVVTADGETVARASAVFRMLGNNGQEPVSPVRRTTGFACLRC